MKYLMAILVVLLVGCNSNSITYTEKDLKEISKTLQKNGQTNLRIQQDTGNKELEFAVIMCHYDVYNTPTSPLGVGLVECRSSDGYTASKKWSCPTLVYGECVRIESELKEDGRYKEYSELSRSLETIPEITYRKP